jgi:DNA-directed RNA polymerase specialized sigma24 family protein
MPNHSADPASTSQESFNELFVKARSGSPAAVQAFFDAHAKEILHAIRMRIDSDARAELDSDDILQRARIKLHIFKLEEKFFQSAEDFLAYMIVTAQREVQQVKRKHFRQTEGNRNRKRSIETLSEEEVQKLVDPAPGCQVVAMAEEEWTCAVASLPLVYRFIVIRLRQGFTQKEIATELKICERTVGWAVKMLADALKKSG